VSEPAVENGQFEEVRACHANAHGQGSKHNEMQIRPAAKGGISDSSSSRQDHGAGRAAPKGSNTVQELSSQP